MNDDHRHICASLDWPFLHRLRTATTVASTTFVNLPYDVDLVESVFVTVSSTRYSPKPAPSREFWDQLHYSTITSDTPEWWFVYNGQIGLWPRPSSSSNVISLNSRVRVIDLNTADVTSGTITTLANGSTALTMSAVLTVQMAGFWIRPTFSTTANTGDGEWYEISSVTNTTTATLVRSYGGTSIAAGTAASTIGQMPLLPEAFHDDLVFKASAIYWYNEGDSEKGDSYMHKYTADMKTLDRQYGSGNLSMVIDPGDGTEATNPNLTIEL